MRSPPLGTFVCVLTQSQPLQEPQGSPSLPLRPLHQPLTPPGVSVLSAPLSFLDQTRVLKLSMKDVPSLMRLGRRPSWGARDTDSHRHRPPPHVHPGSLSMSLTGSDPPSHTHTHTQHTHTKNMHIDPYTQGLPSACAVWAGPPPGSQTLPWRRPQVPPTFTE